MTSSLWRAVSIPIADGVLAVDVADSGRRARHHVSWERGGVVHPISSVEELASVLSGLRVGGEEVAKADAVSFGFVLCVLSDRPYRILAPDSSIWPDLERHFNLRRIDHGPKVENGRLTYLASAQYSPVLKVHRLTADLRTFRIGEEVLISAPWPPAPSTT